MWMLLQSANLLPQLKQKTNESYTKKFAMATSDPLVRAQDVKRCQLCPGKDRKSAAETVCNTCHVNLCKDCVGHHMTSNPTIRHDVVTFKFKILEIIPPQCKLHQNKKCEMFCEQCDSPICLKCLASGSHENHDVSQISEIHISRKQLIEKDTKELESNIAPVFESILSAIEEMLSNVLQKHGGRQHAISEFGKRCHTLVDIVINRYLSDSKTIAKQDGDSIQTLKSEFQKLQSSIESAIHENHSILASNDLSKFTSYASRNEELRNVPSRFELTVPPLDLRELTEEVMCQLIGVIPTSIKKDVQDRS
ncbi:E3 ubiquitin-protein ligase TRIM36-like [Ostrea edulis]|uniref:E3 ubiquitin-protein ligase TRIM36-like n=1 Tax=Ostrea edulis TaxID=37623 RepID=UPI0024AED0A7|nr:E3 ubiquitin-protein ligase TRIM36-like [Ostrea edulis]XP_048767506.2 E3 ubiquitin-protein ligase TRIM36-like [Ostrea edulis]XP_048767507.2 E3 ubiquitin-protein ligase TRIM36-like [Ostrea edulis]